MTWQLIYWPAAIVLLAWAQGWLMPAIKRTPPGPEAKQQDVALHGLLTAAYFLALVFQPSAWLVAMLSRLLLFDPVLNLAAGDKVFAVGSTARTDKALRWLAGKMSWPPERLRLAVWVVSLVGAGLLLITYN